MENYLKNIFLNKKIFSLPLVIRYTSPYLGSNHHKRSGWVHGELKYGERLKLYFYFEKCHI